MKLYLYNMSKSKVKYYVVWVGLNPGIYDTWSECQAQIKGYPKATYKSFKSREEAEKAFKGSATEYISKGEKKEKVIADFKAYLDVIDHNSISVDAACSNNPGLMEYRAVATISGEEIFKMGPFENGTNNVGEFLALVHALAYLKKANKEDVAIYSDSRTAMAWVRNKKLKTTLKKTMANEAIFTLIERAVKWLHSNDYKTTILKWDTVNWGEIPADFGRK